MTRPTKRIAIIGAGSSGMVQLKNLLEVFRRPEVKYELDVVVFESKPEVGGVWCVVLVRGCRDEVGLISTGTRTSAINGTDEHSCPVTRARVKHKKGWTGRGCTFTRRITRTRRRCTRGSGPIFPTWVLYCNPWRLVVSGSRSVADVHRS